MKYGFSLLLVCIVTVAGVAMLLLGIDLVRPFRSANVIVRQEPEPPPKASLHARTKQASKPARSRVPQTRAVVEPAPTQEVSTGDPIVAGDQIPAATQKETILKMYGYPALSSRRVDRGHDLETLVYTRDRGKEVTVISLEDGKVSSYSQSGITSAVDSRRPRPDEHTAALLARPTEPQPASIAIPPTAEAPKTIPKVLDKTLAEVPTATKPPGQPSVQGNVGTCGEYRDGKLTVKPCSQVPLSPSEWLAKGSGAAATESAPAGTALNP
jgi:hypothetical protein